VKGTLLNARSVQNALELAREVIDGAPAIFDTPFVALPAYLNTGVTSWGHKDIRMSLRLYGLMFGQKHK
jgi:hypothetical protein